MAQQWIAKWTGSFPNKCRGLWYLYMNGIDVSRFIPLRDFPANTFGTYKKCTFINFMESWSSYEDGYDIDEWIDHNKDWIDDIGNYYHIQLDDSDYKALYKAFSESDWRAQSCGGCI